MGLRVHKARVGAIPWPLQNVLDRIADAAKKANVDIRWRQEDNDPVALIKITPAKADGKRIVHIDTIRLEEGALVVAGTTEKAQVGPFCRKGLNCAAPEKNISF